ncbi:unnamed protein product [Malus baccata var. baccata]
MIENGRFQELESIIDILPARNGSTESHCENAQNCVALSSFQTKKRQIFVFSTTITLSHDFRKKMKCSSLKSNQSMSDWVNSVEVLSERAGMRDNVAVIDLTNTSILANKLVESFVEYVPSNCSSIIWHVELFLVKIQFALPTLSLSMIP